MTGFLPRGAVTGVGSLPFTDPEAAVRFVARQAPEVPFWPQLPRRDPREGIIEQGLGPLGAFLRKREGGYGYEADDVAMSALLDGLLRPDAALDPAHASGFFAFLRALDGGALPRALALKGQIEGPVTLVFHLFHEGRAFAAHPFYLEAVSRRVAGLARWQVRRLSAWRKPVLLVVDEPALFLANDREMDRGRLVAAVSRTLDAVREEGGLAGLHCCGPVDYEVLRELNPDVFSFDAHRGLEGFGLNSHARAYATRRPLLAFGLVPTEDAPPPAASLFHRWLGTASLLGDVRGAAENSLVTATCGLGLADPDTARLSFARAAELSGLIRRIAAHKEQPEPARV